MRCKGRAFVILHIVRFQAIVLIFHVKLRNKQLIIFVSKLSLGSISLHELGTTYVYVLNVIDF